MTLHVRIDPLGQASFVYDEALDLRSLGPVHIRRAGQVEPDEQGRWWADLSSVGGPRLGPFEQRSQALALERDWLESHGLRQLETERRAIEIVCRSDCRCRPAAVHRLLGHSPGAGRLEPPRAGLPAQGGGE